MRIYRERITPIAKDIVAALQKAELIEVEPEMVEEVELDIESVLKEYRRADYQLTERARDLVSQRELDYSHTFKLKAQLASKQRFGLGEDGIEWIIQQMLEILLQSKNLEEIFGEDHEIRRAISPILKKELSVNSKLDMEVKRRIKNMQEGTSGYDVEYQKAMEKIRQSRGMDE